MTEIKLGTKVEFSNELVRRAQSVPGQFKTHKWWERNSWKNEKQLGVVVGIRMLADGHSTWYGSEAPTDWKTDSLMPAYLVAYHLRRSPVYVLADDLVALPDFVTEN